MKKKSMSLQIIDKKYQDLLIGIKEKFSASSTSIHKARNEIKIIQFQTKELVVKSFKIPNIFNRVVYTFFRDSKAKKSYDYSLKIINFTPQPIGFIEFYEYGLLKNSYFISENFNYDFTIREPLLDENFPDREAIFRAFANFTLALHDNNIFHDDYSPGNILIKKEEQNFIFKIVDINRMKFIPLSADDRAKNFSKLWADEETLNLISNEYLKSYQASSDFSKKVLDYSQKNKNIKNFKKRLKGKPVTD